MPGVPNKQQIRDLIKTTLFFYQVANEEQLVDSLIKEGTRCIDETKYDGAMQLFEEAHHLEKWRDIYGPLVLANLAYICVKKGNYLRAKQFVDDYIHLYGSSELAVDPDEHFKIT